MMKDKTDCSIYNQLFSNGIN